MAHGYYRWVVGLAIGTICSITAASSNFDGTPTTTSPDWGYGCNTIVVSYPYYEPSFGFAPAALFEDHQAQRTSRNENAFVPMAVKERASRAAIRPTSIAGWRSGRVRRLAA